MLKSVAPIEVVTHASVGDVGKEVWDQLCTSETPPFLRYEWLNALETTGAVSPEAGWGPLVITLESSGRVLAGAPAYVKGHSMGEFVFDHAWAQFCESTLGQPYYPKLIVAVPFTPATGSRLLLRPDLVPTERSRLRHVLVEALRQLTKRFDFSSAHVLFSDPEEAADLQEAGLVSRHGVQYHWRNAGYETFDDFLARFNAKRRHQLKRESRALRDEGIELKSYTGVEIAPSIADHAYELYQCTIQKHFWGRRYLNRAFFEEVASTMPERLHVVLAHEGAGRRVLGGAFNLLGHDTLYGRYWGATTEHRFLHFNVCYYEGVRQCIQRGLARFEPGAGGEHKLARGFEPTITHSTHYLRDERLHAAISDFLVRESEAIDNELAQFRSSSAFKAG